MAIYCMRLQFSTIVYLGRTKIWRLVGRTAPAWPDLSFHFSNYFWFQLSKYIYIYTYIYIYIDLLLVNTASSCKYILTKWHPILRYDIRPDVTFRCPSLSFSWWDSWRSGVTRVDVKMFRTRLLRYTWPRGRRRRFFRTARNSVFTSGGNDVMTLFTLCHIRLVTLLFTLSTARSAMNLLLRL